MKQKLVNKLDSFWKILSTQKTWFKAIIDGNGATNFSRFKCLDKLHNISLKPTRNTKRKVFSLFSY